MTPLRIFFIVMALWNLAEAQKSFYASKPRSKLLPRYRQNETETTTDGLGNRGGDEFSGSESSTQLSNRNQFEGTLFEDQRFINRVAQWPEERQPFWFKNRDHISTMRGQERVGSNNNQESLGTRFNPDFQTPFLGNRQQGNRESTGTGNQWEGNREFGNDQGRRAFRRNSGQNFNFQQQGNFERNRPRFLNRDY